MNQHRVYQKKLRFKIHWGGSEGYNFKGVALTLELTLHALGPKKIAALTPTSMNFKAKYVDLETNLLRGKTEILQN